MKRKQVAIRSRGGTMSSVNEILNVAHALSRGSHRCLLASLAFMMASSKCLDASITPGMYSINGDKLFLDCLTSGGCGYMYSSPDNACDRFYGILMPLSYCIKGDMVFVRLYDGDVMTDLLYLFEKRTNKGFALKATEALSGDSKEYTRNLLISWVFLSATNAETQAVVQECILTNHLDRSLCLTSLTPIEEARNGLLVSDDSDSKVKEALKTEISDGTFPVLLYTHCGIKFRWPSSDLTSKFCGFVLHTKENLDIPVIFRRPLFEGRKGENRKWHEPAVSPIVESIIDKNNSFSARMQSVSNLTVFLSKEDISALCDYLSNTERTKRFWYDKQLDDAIQEVLSNQRLPTPFAPRSSMPAVPGTAQRSEASAMTTPMTPSETASPRWPAP